MHKQRYSPKYGMETRLEMRLMVTLEPKLAELSEFPHETARKSRSHCVFYEPTKKLQISHFSKSEVHFTPRNGREDERAHMYRY